MNPYYFRRYVIYEEGESSFLCVICLGVLKYKSGRVDFYDHSYCYISLN